MKGLLALVLFSFTCLCLSRLYALDVRPVERISLKNGVTIIAKVDRRKELVGVHTFIKAGWGSDEAGKAGLTNLLFDTLTAHREQSKDLIDVSSGCEEQVSFLRSEVLAEHLAAVIRLHANLLIKAKFNELAFEEYRNMAMKRSKFCLKEPLINGFSHCSLASLMIGPSHSMAKGRYGHEAELVAMTRNDLRKGLDELLWGNNLVISLVGNFDIDEAVEAIRLSFGSLPANGVRKSDGAPIGSGSNQEQPHKSSPSFRQKRERRLGVEGLKKTFVTLAFPGPSLTDEDFYAMSLIETWLLSGQRGVLNELFGKDGPITDFGLNFTRRTGKALLFIDFASEDGKVDWAISKVLERIYGLSSRPLFHRDLHHLKLRAKNGHALERQRAVMSSYLFGRYEALANFEIYSRYEKRIDDVNSEDIARVASKYLNKEHLGLFIVQPSGSSRNDEAELEKRVYENGLQVIVKPSYGDEVIGITIGLPLGSGSSPKGKEGLNELFFQMLSKGSTKECPNGGLRQRVEEHGAIMQCPAALDSSAIVALTTKYFFPQVFSELHSLYFSPLIDEGALKESRHSLRALAQPFMYPEKALVEPNSSIDVRDLRRYHEKHFTASQTTIVVCGDVAPQRVFQLAAQTFGRLRRGGKEALGSNAVGPVSARSTNSSKATRRGGFSARGAKRFLLTFPVSKPFRDYAPLQVLVHLLAGSKKSPLASFLKKRGLPTHSLRASVRFSGKKANICISGIVDGGLLGEGKKEDLDKIFDEFFGTLPSLTFSDKETRDIGRKLALAMISQHENKLQESFSIFWCNLHGPSPMFFHRLPEFYRKVRADQLAKLAKESFRNHHLLLMGH